MSDISDYIKTQWDDIHHSRNQDWKFILLIVGIITTLITKDDIANEYKIMVIIAGQILTIFGFYIALAHFIIFRSKMSKIAKCEKKLDFGDDESYFNFKFKYGRIAVQQVIMLLYTLSLSVFSMWLLKILSDNKTIHLSFVLIVSISVFIFTFFTLLILYKNASILRSLVEKPILTTHPEIIHYATQEDLINCLNLLKNRGLKLIVPNCLSDEKEWKESKWTHTFDNNGIIKKDVLLNTNDNFQLSVANSETKQDYHLHHDTFDIYISNEIITVFDEIGGEPKIKSNGIVIIPPGNPHLVKLSGLTYVFQINEKLSTVQKDKVIVEE